MHRPAVTLPRTFNRRYLAVLAIGAAWSTAVFSAVADEKVLFNRDIRPILSDVCYACHGPDQNNREADLRLDQEEDALADRDGHPVILPGDAARSELFRRITSTDPDERMPPVDSGRQLTEEQIELVRRWIEQGAPWQTHWSLIAPQRAAPPHTNNPSWVRNAIDSFILVRLEQEGFAPSPEAERETLIRRLTLDLTGLPPTPAEVHAFLTDDSPDAYEKAVDRLLSSPRYGERMAVRWLDRARYADSHGYETDQERTMWHWRDWVIRALNENKPFDEFTIEQLAGDLLPEPTLDQKVATGFNRNHRINTESGVIPEEFRVEYVVDRVDTTATTWMGMTLACARCHEHKYDPLTQKDFYRLFAFFNNVAEEGLGGKSGNAAPLIQMSTSEQAATQSQYRQQTESLESQIKTELAAIEYEEPGGAAAESTGPREHVWFDDDTPAGAKQYATGGGPDRWLYVSAPEGPVHSGKRATMSTAQGRAQHYFQGAKSGLRIGEGDVLFAHVYLDPLNPPRQVAIQFHDGSWEHRAFWGEDLIDWGVEPAKKNSTNRLPMGPLPEAGRWVRLEVKAAEVGFEPGKIVDGFAFTQFDGTLYWDTAGIFTSTYQEGQEFVSQHAWERAQAAVKKSSLAKTLQNAIELDPAKRTEEQRKQVRDYFVRHIYSETRSIFQPLNTKIDEIKRKQRELDEAIPTAMVMEELPKPRETFVLVRGEYDKPGEKVSAGVPEVLPPLPDGTAKNRLALAQWLVDPTHPLTARVVVNGYWEMFFGAGLVRTLEDFGVQGGWPSHPELLDWLATEFVRLDWDVKAIQRLMVTSAAYRQSSKMTPGLVAKDPANRLLARAARHRLPAETIRDQALAVGGLLVEKLGGPSVKPYQPPGLWTELAGNPKEAIQSYQEDRGEKLYRRSMYTFWKRTVPPASMATFDAPSREMCTVGRSRTNTPLQSLALLNDTTYVEASRGMAERMMTEAGATPEERIAHGFRLATARRPSAGELEVLLAGWRQYLDQYRGDVEAARKVIQFGESRPDERLDASELAAYTMVASVMLNLDEAITRE